MEYILIELENSYEQMPVEGKFCYMDREYDTAELVPYQWLKIDDAWMLYMKIQEQMEQKCVRESSIIVYAGDETEKGSALLNEVQSDEIYKKLK